MADIEKAIRLHLLADATIAGLVGNRIYADTLAQGATLPAIVLEEISETPANDIEGIEQLSQVRLRARCYVAGSARTLRRAVIDRLCGTRGTTQTVWIASASLVARGSGFDDPIPGNANQRPFKFADFYITYRDE